MSDNPFDGPERVAFELGYRRAQMDALLDSIEAKLDALIVQSTPTPTAPTTPKPKRRWRFWL